MYIVSILFSFLSGLLISTQGLINSIGSKAIGTPAMIAWLSLVQAIPPLLLMIFKAPKIGWSASLSIGFKWYLFSGIIGIVVLTILSFAISNIGSGAAFVIVVLGQIIGSAIADHFGLFGSPVRPVNTMRIVSIAVIIVGVFMLLKSTPEPTNASEVKDTSAAGIENQAS